MKKQAIVFLCLALNLCPAVASSMEVAEAVIATGVSDRRPVGVDEVFPVSVEKLFCFTEIVGADADASITHVWSRAGREMARVELLVHSSPWRTWSSKNLLPEWSGEWKVEIFDNQGRLLQAAPFVLEGSQRSPQ